MLTAVLLGTAQQVFCVEPQSQLSDTSEEVMKSIIESAYRKCVTECIEQCVCGKGELFSRKQINGATISTPIVYINLEQALDQCRRRREIALSVVKDVLKKNQ